QQETRRHPQDGAVATDVTGVSPRASRERLHNSTRGTLAANEKHDHRPASVRRPLRPVRPAPRVGPVPAPVPRAATIRRRPVPRLVGSVEDKRALAEREGTGVVDMESAAVAEACRRAGVPFGCVRVVSDDCETPLSPKLISCLNGGGVAPLRLLAATATSPS